MVRRGLVVKQASVTLTITAMCWAFPAWAADDEDKRPRTALELARELGVSGDDTRPDDQTQINVLGKPLIIGGEIGADLRYRGNFEIERGADDDDGQLQLETKLETIWLLGENIVAFSDTRLFGESNFYEQGGEASEEAGAELSEAWILRTNLFDTPLAIQVGRQQLQERREFWWDANLDMIRVHYFGKDASAFVGIGRDIGYKSTLGQFDPEDKDLVRIVANAKWDWADRQEVQAFFLNQRDRSPGYIEGQVFDEDDADDADGDFTWIGLRARGRVKTNFPGKFYYWADVALVRGTETLYDIDDVEGDQVIVDGIEQRKVRGWAFDIGASLELPFEFEPYLTLRHARGSGGSHTFRQTGLQGNKGKFRGNSRFRYYGEVLRPDLSNLAVSTVALGIPVGEFGWIEGVWHNYRQPVADDSIAGSRLGIDPDGISNRLGDEFDLIASYRPTPSWDFELTGGGFRAGPAFGDEQGRWAWLVEFKLDYNF